MTGLEHVSGTPIYCAPPRRTDGHALGRRRGAERGPLRAQESRERSETVKLSAMKLGLQLGYWQAQPPTNHVALAQEAERLGFDSVWTAEAWGSDAFTPLAWIGAQTSRIKLATG